VTILQNVTEDVLTLFDQVNDSGAGRTPVNEIPSRLQSSTPPHLDKVYEPLRQWIMNQLHEKLEENMRVKGVCSDPKSKVYIHVKPENYKYLYRKQYLVATALIALATKVILKWFETGKIEYAGEDARQFNNPVLVAPKKDEHGRLTKIRVCIDPRLLNEHMDSDDHFELPHVGELLNHFAGKKLFGEIDLFEAFLQFEVKTHANTLHSPGVKNNINLNVVHLVSNSYPHTSNDISLNYSLTCPSLNPSSIT
jgi:hypothetical protein